MNAIDIEKLNQLISRTDISGNDKIKWLTDFIDSREFGQQERMYSEEEQLHLLNEYNEYLFSFIDKDEVGIGVEKKDVVKWFEQFKKK